VSLPKAILDYINGVRISEEEIEKRKEICEGCDKVGKRFGYTICTECGCFLSGDLGKWQAPRELCPLGKWKPNVQQSK